VVPLRGQRSLVVEMSHELRPGGSSRTSKLLVGAPSAKPLSVLRQKASTSAAAYCPQQSLAGAISVAAAEEPVGLHDSVEDRA
jgi:hypothetical protein